MGIFEILIVAVVTLLVVGPERMPETVRMVALTIGRLKRALQSARSEIEEHIGADDIRQQLHNESIMASIDIENKKIASSVGDQQQIDKSQNDKTTAKTTKIEERLSTSQAIADDIRPHKANTLS